jgi:hypothetical protein
VNDEGHALLSPAATEALTDEERSLIWAAMSFLAGNAHSVGIPHAEWWQLHYQHGAAFPWRVIDVAAPEGHNGNDHTVFTLRFGDWRHPDDPGNPRPVTRFRYHVIHELRIELEGRGYTLRGVWELRERGYAADLMASSRLPHPRDRRANHASAAP